MVALHIVRRDLIRFVRNPVTTALLFALPLAMAGIFTLIFGSTGGGEGISVRVLVYDEDDSLLSRFLQGGASESSMDERLELVPVGEEGYQMMEEGEASALLHIPKGFTDAFLSGSETTLDVVKNPAQRFLPQLVEEGVVIGAVMLSQASVVFGPELATIRSFMEAEGAPPDLQISTFSVAVNQKMRGLERYLFPPIVALETLALSEQEESEGFNILGYFLPGMAIFGILFMAQAASRDILTERESGLLRHLLTAPVSVAEYLVGKCLSVLVVTGLGFAILVGVGLVAGVRWGSPPAVLLLMFATTLAAAGTMVLIMSLAGTQRQGDAVTTIVIIVWSLLGGAFLPLQQIPDFIIPLSRSTLTYWAVDGFNTLILRGGGLADILVNAAVLATAGVVVLIAGAMVLRRKVLQGVM
jgi:ABC-2 type transport system permease protein